MRHYLEQLMKGMMIFSELQGLYQYAARLCRRNWLVVKKILM